MNVLSEILYFFINLTYILFAQNDFVSNMVVNAALDLNFIIKIQSQVRITNKAELNLILRRHLN